MILPGPEHPYVDKGDPVIVRFWALVWPDATAVLLFTLWQVALFGAIGVLGSGSYIPSVEGAVAYLVALVGGYAALLWLRYPFRALMKRLVLTPLEG